MAPQENSDSNHQTDPDGGWYLVCGEDDSPAIIENDGGI
jgi:hypothetical protein